MTSTVSVALLTALLLVGMSIHAEAQGGPGGKGVKNVLLSIPNLSAEQKTRITDLTNTAKNQTAPLKQQIAAARKDMAHLWAADELDKQAIAAKQGEVVGAMAKSRGVWSDFFVQLHDVLTSPQRAWLALHGPGLQGNDAGSELGQAPAKECPCEQGEPAPAQHPQLLQQQ